MKHHYVPQFLLRRWANAQGKVQNLSVRHGRLVCSARMPEYTGYENGLYAIVASSLGLSPDHLERSFFSPIDNDAAKVLEKFEQHAEITADEHRAWTLFLSSLRIRQPDVLAHLRKQGIALLKATLAERDKDTLPEGWPSTEEWFAQNFPGALDAAPLLHWLPDMIRQDGVMDAFAGLRWWFREFDSAGPSLLLSDLPIHWEGGFHHPGFMIQLPVGPHRVFFGARSAETEQFLDQLPPADLIERINRTSIAASAQRLWALDKEEALALIGANLDILGANVTPFGSIMPTG
ncbi:DUF4238 domain-containing protein [Sphingomonas sp. G-3-2-10]|uniref:DUF4238 domain-containing protein n=1 Tax=Sphingomonas sp. G-3-2-10 TaxID=2728838 RepID=UPI00146E5E81|nr:DUF4238 domain-containing protein [Sphingomonas sp. G-3-2-10]